MTYRTKRCRSEYGRREDLNKEFERCCTFLAEMMEKYGALVLRDIAVEIQYEPETWCDDAEGKRLRYEAYRHPARVGCIHTIERSKACKFIS